MGPLSLDIAIDAPRERVFDFIGDLGRRPTWTDHFLSEYRLERIEAAGIGAAARFRADAPGGLRHLDTVVTGVERPHKIVEQGRGGRSNGTAVHTVWELEGGTGSVTKVVLTFWTESPGRLHGLRELGAGRWWRRRWGRALRRLREQLEAPESGPEPPRLAGRDRQPTGVH